MREVFHFESKLKDSIDEAVWGSSLTQVASLSRRLEKALKMLIDSSMFVCWSLPRSAKK